MGIRYARMGIMKTRIGNTHALERVVKGFANHRRIKILALLQKKPELSLEEIAEELDIHFKTASGHVQRLAISGLVLKRSAGREVRHKITPRAKNILTFLRMLE